MIIEHILAREPMIIELSLASGPITVEHSGPMRVEYALADSGRLLRVDTDTFTSHLPRVVNKSM